MSEIKTWIYTEDIRGRGWSFYEANEIPPETKIGKVEENYMNCNAPPFYQVYIKSEKKDNAVVLGRTLVAMYKMSK